MGKLSPKKERFVEEYLIDLNATQAAIRAGYSEKGARQQAHKLLTKVDIKKEIAERTKKVNKKYAIDHDSIRQELASLAFISVSRLGDKETGIKAQDKIKALDCLAKMEGMYIQKAETEITLNPQTAMEKLTEQLFKAKENDKQNSDDNETA
ncbi:terminase small subunit [Piscirickettsia litoralis]|uniref:Terminase n=1 Tax=Piscirickettsia litoralis TaxID=1891921 RepID=A0ABX2ZYB6_9GAMM|nr:terminase small subunit [Piscirickettsia litoralis]ODN41223.1 hypothetical protein BGC07_17570 [Piscirickettsia litoralis]